MHTLIAAADSSAAALDAAALPTTRDLSAPAESGGVTTAADTAPPSDAYGRSREGVDTSQVFDRRVASCVSRPTTAMLVSDAVCGGSGIGGGGGELGPVQAFFAARGLIPPPIEPVILVACERSGRVRDAYLTRGELAMSCDLEATEADGPHYQGDVRELLGLKRWRIVIAFPPCTDTAFSGSAYFKEKRADGRQWRGLDFILLLLAADADAVLVEQPRSVFGEVFRPPDTALHPYHFGVGEVKQTWFWYAGAMPAIMPTAIADGRYPRSARVRASDPEERRRLRSIIPSGLAEAIAAQMRPCALQAPPRAPISLPEARANMWRAYVRLCQSERCAISSALHRASKLAMLPELVQEAQRAETLPSETVIEAASDVARALLVPVCVLGRPLVLLPADPTLAIGGLSGATRAATEARAFSLAEAVLGGPLQRGETFMAGIRGDDHVTVALAATPCEASSICLAPVQLALRRRRLGPRASCWCALDALAGDPRYELAAEVVARALTFVEPRSPHPSLLRSGVAGDATFEANAADGARAAKGSFAERVDCAVSAVSALQAALAAAAADGAYSAHQRECFGCWQAAVRPPPVAELPHSLRGSAPELPFEQLADLPFVHRAVPPETAPLPPPQAPPSASDELQAVADPVDLFIPELKGYARIRRTLRKFSRWHRDAKAGRKARRPPALALDTSVLIPAAREFVEAGGVIDLRDPARVRLLDPREQPFKSHLHGEAIDAALEACPDRELRCMVKGGVVLKAGVRPQIVLMPNLNSLYEGDVTVDAVVDEMHTLVDRGWYSTHSFIPFIPWRCAPHGAVPRPGGGVPRGIVDNGAPRRELLTWPRGEPVVSVNEAAGPMRPPPGTPPSRVKWHREGKPLFRDACTNGLILWNVAKRSGLPLFVFAFDFKYYFHQLFLRYGEWWLAGSLMPGRMQTDGASSTLIAIVEMVLSMGTSPSSQIAQRFANAILWVLFRRMDEAEAGHTAHEPQLVRDWLQRRKGLDHDEFGTQSRLYDALMYTDDPALQVVGVARSIRLLAIWHDMVGPDGFGLMYAKAAKWHGGVHARWLGCTTAPMLEAAWLTPDKAVAIIRRLDALADGKLSVADHGKLVGQLEHFRFIAQMPPWTMYGMRDAAKAADGAALPPGATARHVGRVVHTTVRWRRAASASSGVWLLAAAPAQMAAAARYRGGHAPPAEWHLSSDAALTGTTDPGLGGYMHGSWWCIPLDDALVRLPIVVLELIAAAVNIIIFERTLQDAPRVVLEIDALSAQLVLRAGRSHSDMLQIVHETLLQLPQFKRLRHRLVARHTYGEANPAADAASRGKHAFLTALCAKLGVREHRVEVPAAAREFVTLVCQQLEAAARPLPAVGGRFGIDRRAAAAIAARAAAAGADSQPHLPAVLFNLDVSPACDDHDGPPLLALRKRALVRPLGGGAEAPNGGTPAMAPRPGAQYLRLSSGRGGSGVRALPAPPPPVAAAVERGGGPLLLARRRTTVSYLAGTPISIGGGDASEARASSAATQGGERLRADTERAAQVLGLSASRVASMSSAAESRAIQMVLAVSQDTSRWALRPADEGELLAVCRLLAAELEAAAPATTLANERSNWKHWEAWCTHMGTTPLRNDVRANSGDDVEGYEREVLLLAAGLPFILKRMRKRPGWHTPPSPLSALQVLRGVRRVHKRLGVPMAPLTMAVVLVNRLLDDYVRRHGHDALQPKRKEPLTNPIIIGMLHLPDGTPIGSARVDWTALGWVALRAMYATLAQTGMRKSEVALPANETFCKRHLSRAALAWRIGGDFVTSPSAEQLARLAEGDYALLTVAPSKADQFGLIWSPAPIVLPFHPDDLAHPICAARELARLETAYPLFGEARRDAPLFVDGARKPLRHKDVDATFQQMLLAAGVPPERAKTLSMHSWRIYLACALLASNASTAQILNMLRWRSDEALRLYARLNDADYATWLDAAADATVDSIRTSNVATLAEAAAAERQREWLRKTAVADERGFDPSATPAHTHDDIITDLQSAVGGLAASAALFDTQDA